MDYIFYEPTIQGKTEVVDGKLVSLQPSIEGLEPLGSVPSISDVHDLASGKSTLNTKEIVLDGSESGWILTNSSGQYYRYDYTLENSSSNYDNVVVTNLKKDGSDRSIFGFFRITNTQKLYIDTEFNSLSQLREWLQSNPVTIRYQLATPIEQQLTPSQMSAYDSHRKIVSLAKVGDVSDKLVLNEDGSGTWVKTSRLFELVPKDVVIGALSNVIVADVDTTLKIDNSHDGRYIISDKFLTGVNLTTTWGNGEYIGYCTTNSQGRAWFVVDKSINTIELAREYLRGNPTSFVSLLANPTTTYIPKSITPTIPIQQTNIVSAGDAVKPSSFTIVVPTTDDVKKEITQTLLNGYINVSSVAKASLLKNGNARIELDITAPTTGMSATILTLPSELRPTANRKIQVFVNGVSQLATVKTDGTLLLSAAPSASANIYIKEEYTI